MHKPKETPRPDQSLSVVLLLIGSVIVIATGLFGVYYSLGRVDKSSQFEVAKLRNEVWALRTLVEFKELPTSSPLNQVRRGLADGNDKLVLEGLNSITKKIESYSGKPLPLRDAGE